MPVSDDLELHSPEIAEEVTEELCSSDADIVVDEPASAVILADILRVVREYGISVEKFEYAKAINIIEIYKKNNLLALISTEDRIMDKLLNALSEIASCDNRYYTLAFLNPKQRSVFRKDTIGLRSQYKKLAEGLKTAIEDASESASVGVHLLEQCKVYAEARAAAIKNYEQMLTNDICPNIPWEEMEQRAAEMTEALKNCHHPDLATLFHIFQEETAILRLLIGAQMCIMRCEMFDSLLKLKEVRERLKFWAKEITIPANTSSLGFFSRFRNSEVLPRNRLIYFLVKFYDLLMAKFSLYFTNDLGKYCSEEDKESIHSIDNKYNFINAFREILRKSGAFLVAIVMDRMNDGFDKQNFFGFGYRREGHHFRPGDPEGPLVEWQAKCPYVFKDEISTNSDAPRLSIQQPSDIYHEDVGRFVHDVARGRLTKPEERSSKLPRYMNITDARVVIGEHIEGSLFTVAIIPSISPLVEGELTPALRNLQMVLRGNALFHDLKTRIIKVA